MKTGPFLLVIGLVVAAASWFYLRDRAALRAARAAQFTLSPNSSARDAEAPSRPGQPPGKAPPSSELLRLRGEVGVLRRQLESPEPPAAAQRQFSNDWQQVYAGVRPSQQPGFVHFTNLTEAGFQTPDAALHSMEFALRNQHRQPLTDTKMMELWDVPDDYDQPPGYNIHIGEGFYGGSGYRIVSRERLSSNSIRLTIDYERDDGSSYRREKVLVERNGRWRMKPKSVTRATPGQ